MNKTIFHLGTAIILMLVTAFVTADVQAYADLSVQYVNVYSGAYNPGSPILIINRIKNVGTTSSNSYTVSFYASTNTLITSSDRYLGSVSRSSLAAGSTHYYFTSASLPSDIPAGNYYIGLIVSCSNDFITSNNKGYDSGPITVWEGPSGYADISVESVNAVNGTYNPGDEIVIGSLIVNKGEEDSESFTVDFYASEDRIIETDDYNLSSMDWTGLSVGESHACDKTARFPDDIPPGEYYIGMRIYCSNDDSIGNNRGYDYQPIMVGELDPEADLEVLSVDAANGTYEAGDEIRVTTRIKNVGELTSNNYTVKYYASRDRTITSGDYLLGSSNRSGLAANAQHDVTTSKRFPSNIPTGNYYIGVIITCSNDKNSSNNKKYDSTTVSIAPSNYSISGRIRYPEPDRDGAKGGGKNPVRYALVRVFDDVEGLFDRKIGETYTTNTGNYNITISNDDLSGRNIYVVVYTDGYYPEGSYRNISKVKETEFRNVYNCKKTHILSTLDSSVQINLDISNVSNNKDNVGAFNVYDSIVEGYVKAKGKLSNVKLPEIMTYWPGPKSFSFYYSGSDEYAGPGIYIEQEDRYDRDTIIHEYGHYIQHKNDFAWGYAGSSSDHGWNTDLRDYPESGIRTAEQAKNLAFREAWAYLFSIAAQYGVSPYPYSGDSKIQDIDEGAGKMLLIDLETDTNLRSWPGEFYESMNCCTLWDIFDNHDDFNDEYGNNSLTKIWTISRVNKPKTIQDFWNSWSNNSEIRLIFKDHRMSFVP